VTNITIQKGQREYYYFGNGNPKKHQEDSRNFTNEKNQSVTMIGKISERKDDMRIAIVVWLPVDEISAPVSELLLHIVQIRESWQTTFC
jgi:hypothetical protein